jgi:hypothetical protein
LTIGSGNDNDSTIHRGSTGNHVLDVIGVTRAVDVGVVTIRSFIFNVGSRDGNTTGFLFGSLVNGGVVDEVGKALGGLVLGYGSSQSGLRRCQYSNSWVGGNRVGGN